MLSIPAGPRCKRCSLRPAPDFLWACQLWLHAVSYTTPCSGVFKSRCCAGRDALNPGMIMLQPAAAAGASAKEGPTPPPFHTPRPFVKSEPSATPHDSAGHMGGAGQGSAQLGQPGSHHRRQLQTSTGFDLAARQSLEQRSKTEGARPRPADAFAQVASLSQAAGPGLSFSVPRPPPGSFPGVDPTLKGLREQGLRTELER